MVVPDKVVCLMPKLPPITLASSLQIECECGSATTIEILVKGQACRCLYLKYCGVGDVE